MQIPEIKRLVEQKELAELQNAEAFLMDEKPLPFEVNGNDEGEQLTHLLAAIWIKNDMQNNSTDFRTSLRKYTERVRTSIS